MILTNSTIFIFGAALFWVGIGLGIAFLLRAIRGQKHVDFRTLVFGAASALSLITASSLQLDPGHEFGRGFPVPLVWVVLPMPGYFALGALIFGFWRLFDLRTSVVSDPQRKTQLNQLAMALGVFVFSITIWALLKEPPVVLKGMFSLRTGHLIALGILVSILFLMLRSPRNSHGELRAAKLIRNVGAFAFSLPLLWMLITSFKADHDLSVNDWVPERSHFVMIDDPKDPWVAARLSGIEVVGPIAFKNPDGSALIDVVEPGHMRGRTATAHPPLDLRPRPARLYWSNHTSPECVGFIRETLPDGNHVFETVEHDLHKAGQVFSVDPNSISEFTSPGLRWENYRDALDYLPREANHGLTYLKNSVILVILTTLGTVLSSSIVAFAFARLRFPGKEFLFVLLLSTLMLPAAVTLLPSFMIWRSLGLIDTLVPLWAPSFFGSAFSIFLLRQFFSQIPKEFDDAARLDGCSPIGIYWNVLLPLIKPGLAVVAIWTAQGAWNNFMGPLVYISSPENMPVSYAVQLFQGDRGGEPQLLMAFSTLALLPVVLLYAFTQRSFIDGVKLSGFGGK